MKAWREAKLEIQQNIAGNFEPEILLSPSDNVYARPLALFFLNEERKSQCTLFR